MSLYDYKCGVELHLYLTKNDIPFHSVIQCAMRMADSDNVEKLKTAFPEVWEELFQRYNAPGGMLEGEE